MKNKLSQQWKENLEILDFAFQPIININTGVLYAVEALLRNTQDLGFESIFALFDKVYEDGILYSFDIALREKALKKFSTINDFDKIKLFYNLDNRLLEMDNFSSGNTSKILKKLNIKKENLCFEISERHEVPNSCNLESVLNHYRSKKYCIAIDDFGVGYSGYKLLYESTPNLIKIDRFFLQGIESNPKKKLLVRNITQLAIQLGIVVIAEGIETQEELLTCREIGCHLIQGYFIQRPTIDVDDIKPLYTNISSIIINDRRIKSINSELEPHIDKLQVIESRTQMSSVIEHFKREKDISILPIVNSIYEPVGIIQESQIKDLLYSQYGISLLLNDGPRKSKLKNFITPCGSADINSDIETIIELFSNDTNSVGIIITHASKYYGFLSARSIISIMNEKNILLARDSNPLTKLPGNRVIQKYITDSVTEQMMYQLTYFDLDNFKAFNDVYGFRNGDRVIQLFADMLKTELPKNFFIAHIGGDDFFCAMKSSQGHKDEYIDTISNLVKKFAQNAKEFYSKEDKEKGYIESKDREGNHKQFPLLTVSASILILHNNTQKRCSENINGVLSMQKKVAKKELNHISVSSLL